MDKQSEKYQEAVEIFGQKLVDEVMELYNLVGDADAVYTAYLDNEETEEHASCVEYIFFTE